MTRDLGLGTRKSRRGACSVYGAGQSPRGIEYRFQDQCSRDCSPIVWEGGERGEECMCLSGERSSSGEPPGVPPNRRQEETTRQTAGHNPTLDSHASRRPPDAESPEHIARSEDAARG
jgi:hypothetical protein